LKSQKRKSKNFFNLNINFYILVLTLLFMHNLNDDLYHPYRKEIREAKSKVIVAIDKKDYTTIRLEVDNLQILYSLTSNSYVNLISDLEKTLDKIKKNELSSKAGPMIERLVQDVKKMNVKVNENLKEITEIQKGYQIIDAKKANNTNKMPTTE